MPKHRYAVREELRRIAATGQYPHPRDWFLEHSAHLFTSTVRLHKAWHLRVFKWLRKYRGEPKIENTLPLLDARGAKNRRSGEVDRYSYPGQRWMATADRPRNYFQWNVGRIFPYSDVCVRADYYFWVAGGREMTLAALFHPESCMVGLPLDIKRIIVRLVLGEFEGDPIITLLR
jgi:hypothetical protein